MSTVANRYRAACAAQSGCRHCGAEIGVRRAYCSAACDEAFTRHHFWNTARHEAIRLWLIATDATCRRCQRGCEKRPGYYDDARYVNAARLRFDLSVLRPEVNHIVPLNRERGRSYHFGCFNHQNNLEVLCHDCHVQVTVEQRAAGLIGQTRTQPDLRATWDAGRTLAEPMESKGA